MRKNKLYMILAILITVSLFATSAICSQCAGGNLDELETLSRHELGSLKYLMTLDHIKIRRPYARYADDLIRRASFVGSINRAEFLNDETGTRRFLTFEIDTIDIDAGVDLDGVYAQAYARYREGFRYWFDQAEVAEVNDRNKKYAQLTTEDELVRDYFEPVEADAAGVTWLTPTQVAALMDAEADYPLSTNSAQRFGRALTKAGFQSHKLHGRKEYAVKQRRFTGTLTAGEADRDVTQLRDLQGGSRVGRV